MKVNATKDRKVRLDKNKLWRGKNGSHWSSGLNGRSIVVVKQWDKILEVHSFLKICWLPFWSKFGWLNRFIVLINLYQYIKTSILNKWYCKAIYLTTFLGSHSFPCQSLLLSTSVFNDNKPFIVWYVYFRWRSSRRS